MEQDICSIKLRNVSGVPVIDVIGVLNKTALSSVESTITRLCSAGHYNIVVNVKRAMAANLMILESLADCVKQVRSHYGIVEVVAEACQIAQLSGMDALVKLFRFGDSEAIAFQRIKKLLRPDEYLSGATARLRE
jgi:hypothetical protein